MPRSRLMPEILYPKIGWAVLRVCMEGPSLKDFDPKPSMTLWNDTVVTWHSNQSKQKQYKERATKKQHKTLMDESDSN